MKKLLICGVLLSYFFSHPIRYIGSKGKEKKDTLILRMEKKIQILTFWGYEEFKI